jgi:hypothetical protein
MKRFSILFLTEVKAWAHDPITALGGVIAPLFILVAFAFMFGDRLSFRIALVNQDNGEAGELLRAAFDETISPLDNNSYYEVLDMSTEEAHRLYASHQIDGLWIIPSDFSARVASGDNPALQMHFSNYNDDRAKNHRIYASEVLWRFYEEVGMPEPPLAIAEVYPQPEMIGWVPIIGVGVVLLSATLGGIFNIFALTYKEKLTQITLEFGLAPRSLIWVFLPKVLLALILALLTGTVFLVILNFWLGYWPGRFLWAVWLLMGLTALFWIGIGLFAGLQARNYMSGAVIAVLGALLLFFIGGGWNMVRINADRVLLLAWLFPNTHSVDPMRDLVLFHSWPEDWTPVLLKLISFAILGQLLGLTLAGRRLRRLE